MAMSDSSKMAELLDAPKARLAGSAASLLGLAATAGAAIGLIGYLTSAEARSEIVAYLLLLFAFAGMGLVAGVQLLRGRGGAQQFLLVYWLGVAVAATVMTLSVILWKVPEAVASDLFGEEADVVAAWATSLGVAVLAVAAAAVVLLARASQANSRQRYASIVIVSVAVAVALVIVVNLISQHENPEKDRKNYVHVSMETLGRYGLSERTKKILRDVKTPLRLTCVYTSADEAKQTDELRPRVLELLNDMKIYGENIEVANVATDAGKAKLLARLRGQLGSQADQHEKFLKAFDQETPAFRARLDAERDKWEKHPPDSYLNLWSLPVEIAHVIKTGTEKLRRAHEKVGAAMTGPGLPDYDALVRDIKDPVTNFKESLEKAAEVIGQLGKIAEAAADEKKRTEALAAVQKCSQAAEETARNIGKPDAPDPNDPSDVLNKHVAACKKTADLARAAAEKLDNLAGEDNAELLRQNRLYSVTLRAAGPLPVSVAISDLYKLMAQRITDTAAEAEAVVKNATADYQKKFIRQARGQVAGTAQSLVQAQDAAEAAIQQLSTVDKLSKASLELAAKDELFAEERKHLKATLDAIEKLPELKDTSLSTDITGENLVIVEAGGKAEVVEFDEVWPLKVRNMFGPPSSGGSPQKRVFNGDSAIGSKILSMTSEPFALALLAHWSPGPDMPPQMARMVPPSDIPLRALGTIRKRLEEANFAVEDWDLNEDMPDPNDHKGRPKLLVVLPPPPPAQQSPFQRQPMPMPSFQDEHRQKVTDAIDDGIPAIFLATFSPPRQMSMFMPPTQAPYAYGDYLRDEWGVDVKTDYLVVPAVTDDQMPGRYKVDGQRFSYLPLSAFSDHPIGKPLQAQRVLWANLCPIDRKKDARGDPAEPPPGVTIESLLAIPSHWKSTWATRRIQELLRQFQSVEGSYIWPDYAAGDMPAGFDVAVAATRAEDEERKITPARIVVLGVGSSLMDGYLDREVAVRDTKGTISLSDPPRANADLVVNSAYWLIGRENLIASGPVQATMKEIPPGMKVLLVVIYCGVLPALVVGVGSLVMLKRRR